MPHATWWCHYDLEPAPEIGWKTMENIPAEALPTKTSRWDWDEIGMEVSNSFLESLKCYMKRSGSRSMASKRMEYQPTSTNSSNLRIRTSTDFYGNFAICFSWKISCQFQMRFLEKVPSSVEEPEDARYEWSFVTGWTTGRKKLQKYEVIIYPVAQIFQHGIPRDIHQLVPPNNKT